MTPSFVTECEECQNDTRKNHARGQDSTKEHEVGRDTPKDCQDLDTDERYRHQSAAGPDIYGAARLLEDKRSE